MRRITGLLAGLGAAIAIAACGNGGGGGGGGGVITAGGIAYFVVSTTDHHDTASIVAGNVLHLAGTAYDANYNSLPLNGDTVWTTRDSTIATVDAHGLVTSVAIGQTWILGAFTALNSTTTFKDSALVKVVGPT